MDDKKPPDNTAEQDYSHRCLTCEYWDGPKAKQWADISDRGHVCMHRDRGWPKDGICRCLQIWGSIEIEGDAVATLLVQANHGCIHWDIDEKATP